MKEVDKKTVVEKKKHTGTHESVLEKVVEVSEKAL